MKPNIFVRILRALFVWRVRYPSRAEVVEKIAIAKEAGEPLAILTQEIGPSANNRPGKGNLLLADALGDMLNLVPNSTPVLAQFSVALAAQERGLRVTKTIGPPTPETRLDKSTMAYNSDTVITAQREWLTEHGTYPGGCLTFVLTWPDHAPRVQWLMERQGFSDIVFVPLWSYRSKNYFDRKALYPVMRWAAKVPGGTLIFRVYELMIRALFIYKGLI